MSAGVSLVVSSAASGPVTTQPVTPTTTVSSAPSLYLYNVFHTCRGHPACGLNLRSGPGTNYAVVGQLSNKEQVEIVCQTAGQAETNSNGITTDVWDKLAQGSYVTDLYIDTPGSPISSTSSGFTSFIPQC